MRSDVPLRHAMRLTTPALMVACRSLPPRGLMPRVVGKKFSRIDAPPGLSIARLAEVTQPLVGAGNVFGMARDCA
jgi:hypothetical protein